MAALKPRPAVVIDTLFDDPSMIARILERESPHPTTLAGAEFVESRRQLEAAAASEEHRPRWLSVDDQGRPVLAGVFRTTWADGDDCVEEADVIADSPVLIEAARKLFDAEVVRPYFVYANISTPKPRDVIHTDITAFRGIDRHNSPTWLINAMNHSGLFGQWQVKLATGVAWFYEGVGGEFSYWPDGRGDDGVVFDAHPNSCIVGDNDRMPHCVEQIGDGSVPQYGFDATIALADNRWIVDDLGEISEFERDEVRVSVSWKAEVFVDEAEAAVFDDHSDDLELGTVSDLLKADLAGQDIDVEGSVLDPEFAAAVRARYVPLGI